MKEFGTFKTWEAIDLFEENRKLKNTISDLENEVKLLKGK